MQSSLPAEPIDRNIKAVDVAEIGDIAKIVETAIRTDAQSTTWGMPRVNLEIITRKAAIPDPRTNR
jgi:hypothetical protein